MEYFGVEFVLIFIVEYGMIIFSLFYLFYYFNYI